MNWLNPKGNINEFKKDVSHMTNSQIFFVTKSSNWHLFGFDVLGYNFSLLEADSINMDVIADELEDELEDKLREGKAFYDQTFLPLILLSIAVAKNKHNQLSKKL